MSCLLKDGKFKGHGWEAPSPPGFTGWGLCRHLGERACCLCKPYLPNFFVRQASEATPNVWREAGEDKATERTLRSKSLKKTLEHFSQGLGGWRGLSTSLTLLAFVTTSPAFQRVFSFAPSLHTVHLWQILTACLSVPDPGFRYLQHNSDQSTAPGLISLGHCDKGPQTGECGVLKATEIHSLTGLEAEKSKIKVSAGPHSLQNP